MKTDPTNAACPQCGSPIPADAPRGLCPRCMIAGVAAPTDAGLRGNHRVQPPPIAAVAAAFPDLENVELIGVGGMGVVYKARQPKHDRWVALKLLPPSLGADPTFAERFNREARFLARLTHPNIVAVFDFGQAGGFCYLLMEFVDGVNLRQAMRAGRFSPTEALAIVPRVCDALQYAHDQGVLHRDIKPENILLDGAGRVKIADFGIAKLVGEDPSDITLTVSGARLGTPHYMAPEQIEKPGQVDHRADIYSLGVVFYELLTGELPLGRFSAPSVKATIDARVDEIVMRALAKERELRQQTAGEVGTQVENLATSAGVASAKVAANGGDGKWAGIRVVREESGKPVVHGPGVLLACLAFVPAATVVFVVLILRPSSARHPFEGAMGISAAFLAVVAVLAVRGAIRARECWVPGASPGVQAPALPRWARVVAWGIAGVWMLGLMSSQVDFGPHSSDFAVRRIDVPFPFSFVSIALWTRNRRWRAWATALLGSALVFSTLGILAASFVGVPAKVFGDASALRIAMGVIHTLMLPTGLLAMWHPEVRRAFGGAGKTVAEPTARSVGRRKAVGWALVSAGALTIAAAFLYTTLVRKEFMSTVHLSVSPARQNEYNGEPALEQLVGRNHPECVVVASRTASSGIWMLTARGGRADEVAACANESAEELAKETNGDVVIIDRAMPATRPLRPNGPLAFAVGALAIVALVLPGLYVGSGRRGAAIGAVPDPRIAWWVKGAFVVSALGILFGLALIGR